MQNDFLDAMSRAGIPANHALVFDGKLRRYNVSGDKKGKRNGWYRYTHVRDDFSWGVFGCNKRGISEKWSSIERRKLTKYDSSLIKKRQAEIKKEEMELQARVAAKANVIWDRLKTPAVNAYASRKGVGLYNVRFLRSALVVPVYVNNYLVSLQFVAPDGEKRFLAGGQSLGAYGMIGDETDTLYICEGYATAASIYEATGCMIAIAFYAANLVPVAAAMRESFPDKKIVIAADNDQWTDAPIKNPGISYAREAAEKIGAKVSYPDFSYEDTDHGTDWNDWHARYGIESLSGVLAGIPKAIAPAVEKSWRLSLLEGKESRPGFPLFDPKSKQNAFLFLENYETFKGLVAFNEFTNEIIMMKCPKWENPAAFIPRSIKDYDAAMFVKELEILGIRTGKDIVWDFLCNIAENNRINPPRDYFNSLVWDGQYRVEKWLETYLGATTQSSDYTRLTGSKWLMAIVARSFNPGCKFDNVLVLEGAQGIKKTSAFETLATFHSENYFLEFGGDVTNKDSLDLMQGKIIVEMSELASIRRSEVEDMKLFISRRVDEYRPAYGHFKIKRPRFFVLGASTNKIGQEYLEDETGARRMWPIQCGDNIDLEGLRRDREQLYAEAVQMYKSGERLWLEGAEITLAQYEQSDRQSEDSWEYKINEYLRGVMETTATAVMNNIGLPIKDMNDRTLKRIKNCLISLGWKEFKTNQNRSRRWKKK